MKGLPIGSVQPWVGAITKIPKGWLLCNGGEVNAADFPLLARIIKNTYGGVGFTGDFPEFSGTIRLPPINQKALADIWSGYFSDTANLRPGKMDTVAASNVVGEFIGDIGDLGPPVSVSAETDLNFSYTPDPAGTIRGITSTGVAITSTSVAIFRNIAASGGDGTGALFNVVRNTNSTYAIAIIARGRNYKVGNVLIISGTSLGGATPANNVSITVTAIGNQFFTGTITGQTFIPGSGVKSLYVVPRKLGREHFPQHIHPDTYETINKGDSTTQPGKGVGVFDNAEITVIHYASRVRFLYSGIGGIFQTDNTGPYTFVEGGAQIWGSSAFTGIVTDITKPFSVGPGRFAIGAVLGTIPAKSHTPQRTDVSWHGIGRDSFVGAKRLRSYTDNTSPLHLPYEQLKQDGKFKLGYTIPFADDANGVQQPNYDDGVFGSDLLSPIKKTLFNTAAVSFTQLVRTTGISDVIESHDHESEFNVSYAVGSLNIKPQLSVNVQPNVTPDNIQGAFQIVFTIPSPSLAIVHLIRAY